MIQEQEESMQTERRVEVEQKRDMVERVRKSGEHSRLFLHQLQEERMQRGRQEHLGYLEGKLMVNNMVQVRGWLFSAGIVCLNRNCMSR
jgi:hypothetical protein